MGLYSVLNYSGLVYGPFPSLNHMGILPQFLHQIQETRLGDG